MRKAGVAFLIVIALFVFAFFNDSYITTYECSGVMNNTPITPFIKIKQKSEWAFWAVTSTPFSGWEALLVEIPSTTIPIRHEGFGIKRVGTYLDLYRWPEHGEIINDLAKMRRGQFSLISNALILNISDAETFRGTCTPKNN